MPFPSLVQSSIPVLLSSVFPGLGQWYNREVGKGAAFFLTALALLGVLWQYVDPEMVQHIHDTGTPPNNLGQMFFTFLLLLGVLLWSMYDAYRGQEGSRADDTSVGTRNKSKNSQ